MTMVLFGKAIDVAVNGYYIAEVDICNGKETRVSRNFASREDAIAQRNTIPKEKYYRYVIKEDVAA